MKRLLVVCCLMAALSSVVHAQQPPATPQPSPNPYEFILAKLAADEGRFDEALSRIDKVIDDNPNYPVLLYERALILVDSGKLDRAEVELKKLVTAHPDFYDAQRLLGRLLFDRDRGNRARAEEALSHLQAAWELDRSDVQTGLAVSQILINSDRLEDAAKVLAALSEEAPDQRMVNYTYAQVLTKLGRGNESRPYLERVVAVDPGFRPAVVQLMDIYRDANEFGKAADLFTPLIEQEPTNRDLIRQQALLYLRANDPEKAKERLKILVEADPDDARSSLYLAEAMDDVGQHAEAEPIYRSLLEKAPRNPDVLTSYGLNQLALRKFDEAATMFNAILALPDVPSNLVAMATTQLALIDYQRESYDTALKSAKKVLIFDDRPNLQAIHIAKETLDKYKRYDEALQMIAPLADRFPSEPYLVASYVELLVKAGQADKAKKFAEPLIKAGKRSAMTVAEAFVEANDYKTGIEILERLRKQNPDDADILFELGAFNERSGNQAGAEQAFQALLAKNPDHAATLNYLGYMWAEKGVNLDRAAEMLNRAVSQEPKNGAYLDSLGWAYYQLGKLDLSEKYLADATRILPNDATVREHLGDLFLKKGDYAKALDSYRLALTLKPEAKDEEKIRTKIVDLEKRAPK